MPSWAYGASVAPFHSLPFLFLSLPPVPSRSFAPAKPPRLPRETGPLRLDSVHLARRKTGCVRWTDCRVSVCVFGASRSAGQPNLWVGANRSLGTIRFCVFRWWRRWRATRIGRRRGRWSFTRSPIGSRGPGDARLLGRRRPDRRPPAVHTSICHGQGLTILQLRGRQSASASRGSPSSNPSSSASLPSLPPLHPLPHHILASYHPRPRRTCPRRVPLHPRGLTAPPRSRPRQRAPRRLSASMAPSSS